MYRDASSSSLRRPQLWLSLPLCLAAISGCVEGNPVLPDGNVDATTTDGSPTMMSDVAVDTATAVDARTFDASTFDAASDAGPPVHGMTLRPTPAPLRREMRGVWVATVPGMDFPSVLTLTAAQQRAELGSIVERTRALGLNTIFFQSRVESDALYRSDIEPWSRVLSGTQGRDPGYDPLALLIELAHNAGIEVHAWLNPYRGSSRSGQFLTPNHITNVLRQDALMYGGVYVMDPSSAAVRAWIVGVSSDIARRYDVDGIHMDDFFYPYPNANNDPYPDADRYSAYRTMGGTLSLTAWRRSHVNQMVHDVSQALWNIKPRLRFGISPFGIYRPNMPMGVTGLDAYEEIACDPIAWMTAHTVDYVVPQLYWPITSTGQPFGALWNWWSERAETLRTPVFAGIGAYRYGATAAWNLSEIQNQLNRTTANTRSHWQTDNSNGAVFFRLGNLTPEELGQELMARYREPSLLPPTQRAETIDAPSRRDDRVIANQNDVRAMYLLNAENNVVRIAHFTATLDVSELTPGTYRAFVVARDGATSSALAFTAP